MLSSPEEEVLAKACEAIHKFAEKGNCHLILFSHCLKVTENFAEESAHYIPMCGSPLSSLCVLLLIFLGDENKTSLMCLGAIEPLSRLISHEDKTVRRNAVMALGVMASNSTLGTNIGTTRKSKDVRQHSFHSSCHV